MKKELINHFTWLTNKLSEVYVYDNWNDEVKVREVKDSFKRFYKSLLLENNKIDFDKLTIEEAKELRFSKWDDELDLWLFPLWIVPLIPEGLEVRSISGKTFKYSKESADNDIRFGCVAYGIDIKS